MLYSFVCEFIMLILFLFRYGPREITRREEFSMKGQLTCEFKFATFSCQLRRQHQPDNQEKDLSIQLLEALEPAVCLVSFKLLFSIIEY